VSRRLGLALLVVTTLTACAPPGDGNNPFAHGQEPLCSGQNESIILIAQSVQTATRVPCITGYPAGWSFLDKDVRRDSATYWLTSSVVGVASRAVEVQLLPSCEPRGEPFTDLRAVGADAFLATSATGETRSYVFEGGCIVQQIDLGPETDPLLMEQARSTLGFASREAIARTLDEEYGVTLCGVGAAPCEG
jgi:hypothetical protein